MVTTTKNLPFGAMSTLMYVGNTGLQTLPYLSVPQLRSVAAAPPVFHTASWLRVCPSTSVKLPIATSLLPSGVTSNALTDGAPSP